ncbi:MAG: hypothetical protein E6R04_10770 [Spirochaetes bacterium]|nr:MAG: hypothetical protein E6R04_10770 [Spirochaetota bacterium]
MSLTADDLTRTTGLRPDLVLRFIPATIGPAGPLYSGDHVALASIVKQLTDANADAAAIDAVVRASTEPPRRPRRQWWWLVAAVALIIAAGTGALIGSATTKPATVTKTITAAPEPIDASVPAAADPVCTKWSPLAADYKRRRADWETTDPQIPVERWTARDRELNIAVVPVLRSEAADMRRLADEATDLGLRAVLQYQANYEDLFADRIPTYTPSRDNPLWQAAMDMSNAANSLCSATVPR